MNRWIWLPATQFQAFDVDFFLISKRQYPCQIRVGIYVCELRVHCFLISFWHRACVCWIFLSVPFQCCQYRFHHLLYILLHKQCLRCSSISFIKLLIFFPLCIFLMVSSLLVRWHVFSALAAWCRYFGFFWSFASLIFVLTI